MLKLSKNLQQLSDIEKTVPLEDPQVLESFQPLQQEAGLRKDTYYTVVPKDHQLQSGILPEDQFFSPTRVIFWKTAYALFEFPPQQWDYVQFDLPSSVRFSSQLTRVVGDCYSLPAIQNTWSVRLLHNLPEYVE